MAKRLLLVGLLMTVMTGTGFSQTFTGMFDGYYGYNFNKPAGRTNAFRAFDANHNEFSLSYAELAIDQKAAPVGYRFDLGFGDTASIVNSFEPSGTLYEHIQQAYITASQDKFTVDFGKFVTPAGAEVIETKDNWNYSRGILFTWAIPFYHFGVRTSIAASDKVSVGAFVANGWNNVKDNNAEKTVGFMATLKPGKLTFVNNLIVGKEALQGFTGGNPDYSTRTLWDSISTLAVNDKLSLMANYDYGMDRAFGGSRVHWQGIAAYGQVTPAAWFKFTPRYEWFDDPQGYMTGTSETLKEFTLTGQFISKDGLTLWTEFRRDWATDPTANGAALAVYPDDSLAGVSDNQNTVMVGLTYSFTKAAK